MPALSPLQILPLHVVKLVVGHVVGSSRLVFDGVHAGTIAYRGLLRPLLWACRNFRTIARPLYCSHTALTLSSAAFDSHDQEDTYMDYLYLGYPTRQLTKQLCILVDERAVCSGEALELLRRAPYAGCAFPLVCTLTFIFVSDRTNKSIVPDSLQAEVNISAFAQRVKQMAPAASEIKVRPSHQEGFRGITPRFGQLVSQLFQLVGRIDLDLSRECSAPIELQLDCICNLTHMAYKFGGLGLQLIELMRQNASTLQSLVLDYDHESLFSSLILNYDGSAVTFPHLHTLKLMGRAYYAPWQLPVFSGIAPFPCLRCLKLVGTYPFGDNTLFRGNAATLEYLDFVLDVQAISILCKHRVFTPASHQNLQCVKIELAGMLIPGSFATAAKAMQFVQSIGSRASVRGIKGGPLTGELIRELPLLSDTPHIQVLSLRDMPLCFWDILALVKALPLLSDLYTTAPTLG
ncbi:hypothetical protein GGI00_000712 [Coemansia sp. RSA 2681]|nr:hypothetical protein GGI00_000712 [Coemansia sp. RSA 2681]